MLAKLTMMPPKLFGFRSGLEIPDIATILIGTNNYKSEE